MKIKSTLLVAFCLLLFACPPTDDGDNIQTAVLTETNYAYEGDLYRFALTLEIETLNAQIAVWEDQGENEPGDIDNAFERLSQIDEILLGLSDGISLGFPPIPIPPTPPFPCLCWDLFKDINYIVTDAGLLGFTATLTNENQEEVFSTNLNNPLNTEGLEGDLLAYNFVALQNGYTGNGTLTIIKVYSENNVLNYSIPVTVNELP